MRSVEKTRASSTKYLEEGVQKPLVDLKGGRLAYKIALKPTSSCSDRLCSAVSTGRLSRAYRQPKQRLPGGEGARLPETTTKVPADKASMQRMNPKSPHRCWQVENLPQPSVWRWNAWGALRRNCTASGKDVIITFLNR